MNIKVLTLFPEMFDSLNHSILKKAQEKDILNIEVVNIRDFSTDKHKKCDDYPFGGGAGMVMSVEPIYNAIMGIDAKHECHRVFLSPKGSTFSYKKSLELAQKKDLLLLCGHYEGIDQRVIDMMIDEEISIGDYVLTGGELGAMVVIDATCRHIENVISNDSLNDESFTNNMLEYPQYTRPQEFKGYKVPDVLLSGNHKMIEDWKKEKSLEITKKFRPDLLDK